MTDDRGSKILVKLKAVRWLGSTLLKFNIVKATENPGWNLMRPAIRFPAEFGLKDCKDYVERLYYRDVFKGEEQ